MSRACYFQNLSGHRSAHKAILVKHCDVLLSNENERFITRMRKLLIPSDLIFGMIDDDYVHFILVSLLRGFLLKTTSGIFLRPLTCYRLGWISSLKFIVFFLLKYHPMINIVVYIPFKIAPELRWVSNKGVMDHEFWHLDVDTHETQKSTNLNDYLICVVGLIGRHKGLELLLQYLEKHSNEKIPIALCGRTAKDTLSLNLRSKLLNFAKYNFDGFVDQSQFIQIIQASRYTWCCYDSSYDQASGVFATAIQLGSIPVIRDGSLLQKICDEYRLEHVALNENKIDNSWTATSRSVKTKSNTGLRNLKLDWRTEYLEALNIRG